MHEMTNSSFSNYGRMTAKSQLRNNFADEQSLLTLTSPRGAIDGLPNTFVTAPNTGRNTALSPRELDDPATVSRAGIATPFMNYNLM